MRPRHTEKTLPAVILLTILAALLVLSSSCTMWMPSTDLKIPDTDVLRLYGTDPSTLDPAASEDSTASTYIMQIFSGLVTFDRDLNLVPDIAEDWTVEDTEEGTTYTFRLRQGVKFHDGTPVTAHDFKYSWERACHPDTASPTASTYLNDIIGAMDMIEGKSQDIRGVRVVDDLTLEVIIDQPKSYFLAKLTYPAAFVVDEDNVKPGGEWWRQPNGTGPYQLNGWTDDLLLLERNEQYYREKAKTRYVAFRLWGGVPMQMYETGEIDVTAVSLSDLERVLDETNPLNAELHVFPELSLTLIGFNMDQPPFNDPAVREAFCRALDRDKVISPVLKGAVTAAYGVLPPGIPGYDEGFQGLPFDLERARQLLAEAGYPDGAGFPALVFTVPGDGGVVPPSLVAVLYQWVENLNVNLEIRQIESDAYYRLVDQEKDDLVMLGWVADYPDPQNFLEVLFRSGARYNHGGYASAAFDDLLSQAAIEPDQALRLDLYRQAERLLLQDAGCVPLWFGQNYVLAKPYVSDYYVNPLGVPLLAGVSVAE